MLVVEFVQVQEIPWVTLLVCTGMLELPNLHWIEFELPQLDLEIQVLGHAVKLTGCHDIHLVHLDVQFVDEFPEVKEARTVFDISVLVHGHEMVGDLVEAVSGDEDDHWNLNT